ncbi:MAG: hypothetical protein K0R71_1812 [Bacillales bacterium]|nr:hypothetical protein [Bacillales bacterium]
MDKYRAELKKKLKIANILSLIGLVFFIFLLVDMIFFDEIHTRYADYNFGYLCIIAFSIPNGNRYRYKKALSSDEELKDHYLRSKDERMKMIDSKSTSLTFKILLFSMISVGALLFRKIPILGYTLFLVGCAAFLLYLSLYYYFSKKY